MHGAKGGSRRKGTEGEKCPHPLTSHHIDSIMDIDNPMSTLHRNFWLMPISRFCTIEGCQRFILPSYLGIRGHNVQCCDLQMKLSALCEFSNTSPKADEVFPSNVCGFPHNHLTGLGASNHNNH